MIFFINMFTNKNKIVPKITKTTNRMSVNPIQETEFGYNDDKDVLENKWIELTEREKFKKKLIDHNLKSIPVTGNYTINNFIELEKHINSDIDYLYDKINYFNDDGYLMTDVHRYYIRDNPNYSAQQKYDDILKLIKKINEQKKYLLDVKHVCDEDEKTIAFYFDWS